MQCKLGRILSSVMYNVLIVMLGFGLWGRFALVSPLWHDFDVCVDGNVYVMFELFLCGNNRCLVNYDKGRFDCG